MTDEDTLIDWAKFSVARTALGADFIRILGYFREDGVKSVAAIERAMQDKRAVAMILPAHTLKGEARQFGAEGLGDIAEIIEGHARDCVEYRQEPDQVLEHVVKLRPVFDAVLEQLERESNPLVTRRGFGRRPVEANNQSFGRI